MSTNLKISLGILFVAIVAFAGIYTKFNMEEYKIPENKMDTYALETEENIDDLYNSNQLDKIIEKKKNAKDLESLTVLALSYLQKGSLEFKEKEYGEKGLEIANKILAINKNSVIGFNLKGYAYEIMGDYKNSLLAYKKSLEIEKTASTLNQIGHVYDLMGDDKKSREYYTLAATMSPDDVNVKINLARIAYEEKDYKKALEGFKYVYVNDSNSRRKSEAAYMISQVYLTSELFDKNLAQEYAEKSKQADISFPMAWVGLGQIDFMIAVKDKNSDFQEKINSAIKNFEKAISLNPNQTEAHLWEARLFGILGDENFSKEAYNRALEAVKKDITLMDDSKVRFEKKIRNEMKVSGIKTSSLMRDILVAATFPSKSKAESYKFGCETRTGHGSGDGGFWDNRYIWCPDINAAEKFFNFYNDRDGSGDHAWDWNSGEPICANGATLEWGSTPEAICGNGNVESGEQCDDGNKYDKDGCSSSCKVERPPICGNNRIDGSQKLYFDKSICNRYFALGFPKPDAVIPELPNNSYLKIIYKKIKSACTHNGPHIPENNITIPAEQCDLGKQNGVLNSGCSIDCKTISVCGDGKKQGSEQCDLGKQNGVLNSGCSSTCKTQPICGNGVLEPREQCDNGALNGSIGNSCSSSCKTVPPEVCYCPSPKDDIEYNCNSMTDRTSKCGGGGGGNRCGNGVKESGEECDFTGTQTIGGEVKTCTADCKLTTDDLTDPTDDDLTNPTEQEVCDANPALCVVTPQGNIDVDVYWSVDKIHWDDDFTKLIQLKHSREKVYIKNTPIGICNSNRGTISLYTFGFSETNNRVENYLQKEKANVFGDSIMFTTSPTINAPKGVAFKQKLDVSYCTSDTSKTRELNIKIVDIKQTEI